MKRQKRSRGWLRPRDREQLRLQRLQLDVNDLRQQIDSLRVTRSLLYTRMLNARDALDGSYVRTVREYYDMVHRGYRDELWPRDGRGPVHGREYLASIMDEHMQMGRLRGLDQFISMWKRYTHCFEGLQFEMVHASLLSPDRPEFGDDEGTDNQPSEVVVIANSRFECSIGPQCIPLVFPHVSSQPELGQQLMSKRLRGSGRFTITFDSQTHRVVRFDMSLDIVGALLDACEDPIVVAEVLGEALITPDCCIGDLSEYERGHPRSILETAKPARGLVRDDTNDQLRPRIRRQIMIEMLLSPESVQVHV